MPKHEETLLEGIYAPFTGIFAELCCDYCYRGQVGIKAVHEQIDSEGKEKGHSNKYVWKYKVHSKKTWYSTYHDALEAAVTGYVLIDASGKGARPDNLGVAFDFEDSEESVTPDFEDFGKACLAAKELIYDPRQLSLQGVI